MRHRPNGPVTLDTIYDAIMTLVDELEEHKAQWGEGERSLIDRMDLRDKAHKELEKRVSEVERRLDTLPCPPPDAAE